MKKPVRVTDHAVLRYLERVGGFDVEGLRKHIQSRLERHSANMGVQNVKVDGHRFVIKATEAEMIVVTVLEKHYMSDIHEARE